VDHPTEGRRAMSEPLAETPYEGSEADRLEQRLPALTDPYDVDELYDVADEGESLRVTYSEASEGDVIEQAQTVPLDDDEDRG
jgi:hypothetical protein